MLSLTSPGLSLYAIPSMWVISLYPALARVRSESLLLAALSCANADIVHRSARTGRCWRLSGLTSAFTLVEPRADSEAEKYAWMIVSHREAI